MTEDYINVYGGYAIKLLRLQNEMIQTFERYQRGNKQTVEVRGTLAKRGLMSPPGQGPIHRPTKKGGHCGGHLQCARVGVVVARTNWHASASRPSRLCTCGSR